MLNIVLTTVFAAASVAVLIWGSAVRNTMAREGMEHGAGLMPAGAATEVD